MKRLICLLVPLVLMAQYPQPPNGLLCNGQPCTNPGNPGGVVFTNAEYNIGTVTTAATISPANGNRQKLTLTAGDTAALTFVQPAGQTMSIQIKVIQSSSGSFNGGISGCKWPGGTVPTITQSSGAVDFVTAYLDGANAYCIASQNFQ